MTGSDCMPELTKIILTALFESVFSAIFIGLIVWLVQKKFEENANKREIYNKRIIKTEDIFYSLIEKAKLCFYELLKILSNKQPEDPRAKIEKLVSEINTNIETARSICEYNFTVLSKYNESIDHYYNVYNPFIDCLAQLYNSHDINYQNKMLEELKDLRSEIEQAFTDIDLIYYGKRGKKK